MWGHSYAEYIGSFEVKNQFERGRLLRRNILGPRSPEKSDAAAEKSKDQLTMRIRLNFRARTTAVHVRSRCLSAHGCACLCPADSEGQDAMQQVRVIKSVMPGRCSELLTLRYFGIGIRFDEIRSAVGREAKVY